MAGLEGVRLQHPIYGVIHLMGYLQWALSRSHSSCSLEDPSAAGIFLALGSAVGSAWSRDKATNEAWASKINFSSLRPPLSWALPARPAVTSLGLRLQAPAPPAASRPRFVTPSRFNPFTHSLWITRWAACFSNAASLSDNDVAAMAKGLDGFRTVNESGTPQKA